MCRTFASLCNLLCDLFSGCRWMAMWLAAIGGEMIKLDHSFKAAKRIRDSTGQQQFAAVLINMNEFCQVRNTWHVYSASLAPISWCIQQAARPMFNAESAESGRKAAPPPRCLIWLPYC